MAMTDTVTKVKDNLRITNALHDDEIDDCIEACLADLAENGIQNLDETHPSILSCIKLWCRAHLLEDMDIADRYLERYHQQLAHLQMTEGFGL